MEVEGNSRECGVISSVRLEYAMGSFYPKSRHLFQHRTLSVLSYSRLTNLFELLHPRSEVCSDVRVYHQARFLGSPSFGVYIDACWELQPRLLNSAPALPYVGVLSNSSEAFRKHVKGPLYCEGVTALWLSSLSWPGICCSSTSWTGTTLVLVMFTFVLYDRPISASPTLRRL